jgi:hypothetical protein
VDLIARLENLNKADACRRFIDLAGTQSLLLPIGYKSSPQCVKATNGGKVLPAIPREVEAAWIEGIEYFFDIKNVERVEQLSEFRGWPLDFTMFLIESGLISYPVYKDKQTGKAQRGLAFQVVVPEKDNGGRMVQRPIGYHIRLKPNAGEKAPWRFIPNEAQHGQSIPALPFVLGDFDIAKLLVITEGQWDAITFALAAGGLGEGCNWPHGVGVIGIRGAQGVNTFLKYYRRFWPSQANCLVLADNDSAGRGWYSGDDSFAAKLGKLCAKVAVVDCAPHKDFNDLYRTAQPGPEEIHELLASHEMAIEGEVLT